MRPRSAIALMTAAAVVGASLLVASPASANTGSFPNTNTSMDSGDVHISTVDISYDSTTVKVTFHLQNFVGPDAGGQVYVSDGPFTESTGKVFYFDADSDPADTPQAGTSTTGISGFGTTTDASDISFVSNATAGTVTASFPSSRIFWSGGIYAGGFLSDFNDNSSAIAFQQFGGSSATGFGPVLSAPVPTTTTAALTSPSQVFGSTPAAVAVSVSPINAGTASLIDGTTVIATAPVTNGSGFVVVPSNLAVGTHALSVRFTPSDASNVAASSTATFAFTVISPVPAATPAKATKTTVSLSKKSQVFKKTAVKLSVSVSGKATGKVAVYDGKKKIKTLSLKSGKASYTFSKKLKNGTHKVKVVYTPSNKAAFTASTSKTLKLVVKKK